MKTLLRRLVLVLSAFAITAGGSHPASAASPAAKRPNIIVILVDDMGFSDVGCYGSEIPTPHLDALAAGGLRFTQFYNTARCCPSRASVLTGLYAHQAGVGHMMDDKGVPGYRGFLNDRCVTIAEVLRTAGYFTAATGKWHVGYHQETARPLARGFDRFYGSQLGGFYFRPAAGRDVILGDKVLYSTENPPPDGWYSTDAWTDYGIKFIDEALSARKPFFLYLAHNAPHFPLQAPPEDIARFRGKYILGWDKLRETRHAKQIELGIMDKAWPLSPRPEQVKAWDALTAAEKDRFDHIMAIYAAVMSRLDQSVGRLTAALRERGVLDDTLILFMSDNGGNAEAGPDGTFKGDPPGSATSTVFCGQSWATLENTPLRRYKHFNHEGGIATPLIAHWPAGIAAKGELRRQPGHLIDIMATCVDLSGATYPKELHGKPILPMEGRSLRPAFANAPIERDALYWEHEGNAAIRAGDWKLVRLGRNGAWELYDLKTDRTELSDLAAEQPDRVRELAAKWEAWAERAQVKPYPAAKPAAKPKAKAKQKAKEGARKAMPAVQIDADFPGGNIVVERIEGDAVDLQQDQRDTEGFWFYWYFRCRGAAGRTLNFRFTKGNVLAARGPAASTDGGKTWQWLGAESMKGASFTYAFDDKADDVRFCLAVPYTEANLQAFLKRYAGNRHLRVEQHATSKKGRRVERLRLGRLDGQPKHRVLIACRHHCCEMMASWELEGIMDHVLADDADGRWFRENVEFAVLPFMDKDGVELGDQGKNRRPHDHNRDYMGESIYTEVAALRAFVAKWPPTLSFDLHCPWIRGDSATASNEQIVLVGNRSPEMWQRQQEFGKLLEKLQTGPLPYRTKFNIPWGTGWNTNKEPRSNSAWASQLPGIRMAVTIELPYATAGGKPVTAEAARAFGHDVARAMRAYLEG